MNELLEKIAEEAFNEELEKLSGKKLDIIARKLKNNLPWNAVKRRVRKAVVDFERASRTEKGMSDFIKKYNSPGL